MSKSTETTQGFESTVPRNRRLTRQCALKGICHHRKQTWKPLKMPLHPEGYRRLSRRVSAQSWVTVRRSRTWLELTWRQEYQWEQPDPRILLSASKCTSHFCCIHSSYPDLGSVDWAAHTWDMGMTNTAALSQCAGARSPGTYLTFLWGSKVGLGGTYKNKISSKCGVSVSLASPHSTTSPTPTSDPLSLLRKTEGRETRDTQLQELLRMLLALYNQALEPGWEEPRLLPASRFCPPRRWLQRSFPPTLAPRVPSLHYALFAAVVQRGPDMAPTVSDIWYVPCEPSLQPPEKGQTGFFGGHLNDLGGLLRA